ncbi:hypothetical protein [Streptomyces lydicus]|uniref:hypothetical protein n=1 Tax=Streptomyces lydicus TaxID=47763 RepID=UPI0037ADF9FD
MGHKAEFRYLVRARLGISAAAQVLWSAPRLICVAGDFTRYDVHAVSEHRRSIGLVRYRFFGTDHFSLETVASVTGCSGESRRVRRPRTQSGASCRRDAMADLAAAVYEVLLGLGNGVTKVETRTYRAYKRMGNFACLCPPRQNKLLLYLKLDPKSVDLVPGFTRDLTTIGHHGTGDPEVQLRTDRDLECAQDLFRLSYAAA